MQGQGRHAEAVRCCPEDPRALRHLEQLVAGHRAGLEPIADLDGLLAECRRAVETWQPRPVS